MIEILVTIENPSQFLDYCILNNQQKMLIRALESKNSFLVMKNWRET